MTDQWERFRQRSDLDLDSLGFENTLEIYNASSPNYSNDGRGYDTQSYGSADTTIDGATLTPSADPTIELGGQSVDYDLVAYIDEDTNATIVTYENVGESATRIKELENDRFYEVQDASIQGDGLIRLELAHLGD